MTVGLSVLAGAALSEAALVPGVVIDFTASYVVVRGFATAAGLSAFGFLLGPFVYYGAGGMVTPDRPPQKLLPAPA